MNIFQFVNLSFTSYAQSRLSLPSAICKTIFRTLSAHVSASSGVSNTITCTLKANIDQSANHHHQLDLTLQNKCHKNSACIVCRRVACSVCPLAGCVFCRPSSSEISWCKISFVSSFIIPGAMHLFYLLHCDSPL